MRTWNEVYMRAFGTECKCELGTKCIYDLQEYAKDQNNVSFFCSNKCKHFKYSTLSHSKWVIRGPKSEFPNIPRRKKIIAIFLLTISIPDQCITSWTVLFFMSLTHSKANALQKCDNNVSNYFSHSLCCSKCTSRSWNPSRKKRLFIVTWRQMNFEVCTLPK